MRKIQFNLKNYHFLTAIVIFTGIFLRLIKLEQLFQFTYDESVFAYIGRRIFVQKHIPLIGGVTPFHVHLGPYFYWFSGILLRIGNFYPLIWGVFAAFLAGIVMFLLYRLAGEVFNKKIALFAVLFYAFSLVINLYDRHYWGLMFNPFFSVLVVYSLLKIKENRRLYTIILGIALSLAFHTDPSTLILFIVIIFGFIFFVDTQNKWREFALVIFIFVLSFLPLIIFDIRHKGVNVAGFYKYLQEKRQEQGRVLSELSFPLTIFPRSLARLVYPAGLVDLAANYAYCKPYSYTRLKNIPLAGIFFVLFLLIFPYLWQKRFKDKAQQFIRLTSIYFLFLFLGSIFYGVVLKSQLFDHYFTTALPIFSLYIGIFLYLLWRINKNLVFVLWGIFIVVNSWNLLKIDHSLGLKYKIDAVRWVTSEVGSKKFALESLGKCFKYEGYRYLFTAIGKEPEKSYVDENFFWVFDKLPAEKHPDITIVFYASSAADDREVYDRYQYFLSGALNRKSFGGIEVLIVDNSSGEYRGDY